MASLSVPATRADLARFIDHTLLASTATASEFQALCEVAIVEQVASVCVSPNRVRQVAETLAGTGVLACAVAGFPTGAHRSDVKAFEALCAVDDGADEVDAVLNLGNVLDGDWRAVAKEMRSLRIATGQASLKLII